MCKKTAWSWITAFEANEGFHDLPEWGKHSPVPFILDDEDIKAKCIDWINAHELRRGRAGFTAPQFCVFLVGDTRLDPPTTGILSDILEEQGRKTITERTANTYLHRLGRRYDWLKPGTFSDRHEDFQDDRIHRYLPKEQAYFDQGPNFFRDSNGEWHSIESVETYDEAFFNNPKFFHNILGGDGQIRKINLGGQFHPTNEGPYVLFFSHDESCFPACEVRRKTDCARQEEALNVARELEGVSVWQWDFVFGSEWPRRLHVAKGQRWIRGMVQAIQRRRESPSTTTHRLLHESGP